MASEDENSSAEEVDLLFNSGQETCSSTSETETTEEGGPFTEVDNGRKRKSGTKAKKEAAPAKVARPISTAKKQETQTDKKGDQEMASTEFTPTVLVINADVQYWTGEVAVLIALSKEHPALRILTRRGLTRTLIKAMTQETLDTMVKLTSLQGKTVGFSSLETMHSTTGIVQRAPTEVTTALLRATNPRTFDRMGSRDEVKRRDDKCQDCLRRGTSIVDPDRVSGDFLRPSLHPRPYQMLQMSAIRPYVKNVSPATFNVRHIQR